MLDFLIFGTVAGISTYVALRRSGGLWRSTLVFLSTIVAVFSLSVVATATINALNDEKDALIHAYLLGAALTGAIAGVIGAHWHRGSGRRVSN